MAAPPTTLIPPGAGGPVPQDFCECSCGIPTVEVIGSTRSASASGPGPNGQTPYEQAAAALPNQAYSGNNYQGVIAQVGIQYSNSVTTYNPNPPVGGQAYTATTLTTQNYNTDTNSTIGIASLTDGKYTLRVSFGGVAWQGNSSIEVSWRERTTNYVGSSSQTSITTYSADPSQPPTYVADPPQYKETGQYTYAALSETLTPDPGAMYVDTSERDVLSSSLSLGDSVDIVGPDDLLTFFSRQADAAAQGGANECGIHVTALAVSASKVGFAPYIRPAPGGNPVDIYATETASVAEGVKGVEYSGAQAYDQYGQVGQGYDPVDPTNPTYISTYTNTFSGNIPLAVQSAVNPTGPSILPGQVVTRTPTTVQYVTPRGLVMTLTDLIDTAALKAAVSALITAYLAPASGSSTPTPMPADQTGVLSLCCLPPDELSYAVKQATYQGGFSITVSRDIVSQFTSTPLNSIKKDISFTVDLLTTDLDTGEQTDSQLYFTVNVDTSAATTMNLLSGGVVPVPIPSVNQKVTWSNPQVTTASWDRWAIGPQAQVVDAAAT